MTGIKEINEQMELLNEQYDDLDEEMDYALHELEDVSEVIEELQNSERINSDLLESLINLLVAKNVISIQEINLTESASA